MPSALQHPEVVERYIQTEQAEGRIIGPLGESESQIVHMNRIGVIPKGRTPGRWRLITDLSFPSERSVNDGIDPDLCSLQYTSVDRIAAIARSFGVGALLAKVDIKAAYRLIPVHPEDRRLLGMRWGGNCYVDGMLPFGLRSAPKIFTAVADALEWCISRYHNVPFIDHYLDDFIIVAPPGTQDCSQALAVLERECDELGVPLAPEKKEGPSCELTFLGIQVDTLRGQLSLPREKLIRLQQEVSQWIRRRACRRRELQSLIGTLHHAAKVVHPGRSFVCTLIDLLKRCHHDHHYVRLNMHVKADLWWWKTFADRWNGVAFFSPAPDPAFYFASDASGSWGCGAWSGSCWWQLQWPTDQQYDIAFKELFAVVLSVAVWGRTWHGQHVHGYCDNKAVTTILRSRSSRDPSLMHLLRCLFFIEAQHDLNLSVSHVAGSANGLADHLSRNRLSSFFQDAPGADPIPSPIPPKLPALMLDRRASWTSPNWTQQFADTTPRVSNLHPQVIQGSYWSFLRFLC